MPKRKCVLGVDIKKLDSRPPKPFSKIAVSEKEAQ